MKNFVPLSLKKIRRLLPNSLENIPIYIYDSIDSTNTECKRINSSLPFAVLADSQTAGRGRQGKSFFSPSGTGLYLSIAIKSDNTTQLITLFSAVAVCRAIETVYSVSPKIKWVNDIYLRNKKVCGILCEKTEVGIIIGIGINCSTDNFPESISSTAGSLSNNALLRNILAAEVIKNMLLFNGDFLDEYRRRSFLTGKEIYFTKNGYKNCATVCGIDDAGNLLIEYFDGKKDKLNSGEVQIKKPF